ncbi:hypothetical protein NQK81_33830 [Amycolatopsis roodepoortensis]|uniref:hypothetical protein n=1 Tax=Amycolatopsis roodepoortensis TaxID=700274 RepID=UPI00214C8457|nr:hypothetical protein [Amycolatopsis roodepoortensis]UUV29710.1 hypothetical protein NQK81_33830 [Amycolatopsis roodepoortensis]
MPKVTISAKLGDGMLQHLYAEPTVVEEACGMPGDGCAWDSQCCPGHLCNWFHCQQV